MAAISFDYARDVERMTGIDWDEGELRGTVRGEGLGTVLTLDDGGVLATFVSHCSPKLNCRDTSPSFYPLRYLGQ